MSDRVLGVLGGTDIDDVRLAAWASTATHIYAADSGADRLISLGFSPTVVGDFDSFTSLSRASHLRLVQSLDQDTTDCDKLLALVAEDGHTGLTLTGTEGDLPDHVLATYSSAVASGLDVSFAFRRGVGALVRPGTPVSMDTLAGQRVSLVPLTPCYGTGLTGVAWPLDGAALEPGGLVSVSNEAVEGQVTAWLETGHALLFLETPEVVW